MKNCIDRDGYVIVMVVGVKYLKLMGIDGNFSRIGSYSFET